MCVAITPALVGLAQPKLFQRVIAVRTELIKKHTATHYACGIPEIIDSKFDTHINA